MQHGNMQKLFEWINEYNNDPEFAERCELYIQTVKRNKMSEPVPLNERNIVDQREQIENAFIEHVDQFCFVMQEKMSRENTDLVRRAMLYAFDNDTNLNWFGSSSRLSSINVHHFCRLVYHLFQNSFFEYAKCCGDDLTPDSIAHILLGHENCSKYACSNPNIQIFDGEKYKLETISSYMYKKANVGGFETFCKSLKRSNFSDKCNKI